MAMVSASDKLILAAVFYICLLFRFLGHNFPCDLNFLMDLRNVTDFQFVHIFIVVVKVEVMTSKLFIY